MCPTCCRIDCCHCRRTSGSPNDPRDEDGIPPIEDPRDEDGIPPIEDPRDEDGIPPIEDPRDEDGIPPIEDPGGAGGRGGHSCGCCCGCGCGSWRRPSRCGLGTDPRDEDGIPPIEDPRDEDGIPPIEDPYVAPGAAHPSARGGQNSGRAGRGARGAHIVVRLAPQIGSDCDPTLRQLAERHELVGLLAVLDKYSLDGLPVVSPEQAGPVRQWETCAARGPLPPLRSLTSYWRLDVRGRSHKARKILRRLRALDEVAAAYRELEASDPAAGAVHDPWAGDQGYLEPAPVGIDACFAWNHTWGEGVGFADLEQGWLLGHEDLPAPGETFGTAGEQRMQLVFGDDRHVTDPGYVGNHGAAALGEVVAVRSEAPRPVGIVGIASAAAPVKLLSHWRQAANTNGFVAEAIVAALAHLQAGDVLLLEVQRNYLPTEVHDADFDAIRLAVSRGIVVIEAAGNGHSDLDSLAILNRCSTGFRDSGAVMVGCALSQVPHDRKSASNYGSRVDCYAWGDNVVSCGYGDLQGGPVEKTYTATFANTSAASPIIAGAALLVQSRYQQVTGERLTPLQMRGVLAQPATGTPQGPNVAGRIGVMPDLRAIFHRLKLVPEPYLSDHTGDTGAPRAGTFCCASPDLVQRTADGKHRLHLGVCNRGVGKAEAVRATVYVCPVATLPSPDLWHEVGTTEPIDVHPGGSPCAVGPVLWAPDEGRGRVCLVAHLLPGDGAGDGRITTWRDYLAARRSARLTVNNVHDLDLGRTDDSALPFLITGAPQGDRSRHFAFEVVQRLPEGVRVALELPPVVRSQLARAVCTDDEPEKTLRLPPLPRILYRGVRLAAGARHQAVLHLEGLDRCGKHAAGEVAFRQIWAGREVGRITWRFGRS